MSFNELILTVVFFSGISNPMLDDRSPLTPQSTALWSAAIGVFVGRQPVRSSERYSTSSPEFMMASGMAAWAEKQTQDGQR
jgi:hypothetical protein